MGMPQLAFRAPVAGLSGLVSTYYWLDAGDGPIDDMIHPEWANVRLSLKGEWTVHRLAKPVWQHSGAALFGPTSRGARIAAAPGSALLGFGLLPMGFARLIGGPAQRLADCIVPFEADWPWAQALYADCLAASNLDTWAAILDFHLIAALANRPPAPPLLARAHDALVHGDIATVERFAQTVGVSVRTLERLCGTMFGFGPKTLLRRQRFLRSLDRMIKTPDGAHAAVVPEGYVDQSHFIHEFKAFMGVMPGRYLAQPRVVMQIAAAKRAAQFGQTLQGLHAPV